MAEYHFIVNPKSRTGKALQIWQGLKAELEKQNIDYDVYQTAYAGHARELAEQLTKPKQQEGTEHVEPKESDIRLVVVGGDGTFNEVINGICDFQRVEIGLIPTGSGNDLGRGLGLTGTPVDQLNRILHADELVTMDLGEVSWNQQAARQRFAISAGVGLDADVCRQATTTKVKKVLNAIGLGNLTYVILTIRTLFSMETATATVELDTGEQFSMKHMICIVAMNLPFEGGGVPMAPKAVANDGKLSFCCIAGIPKWRAFLCLPFLVAAKHEKIRGFTIFNCKSMELTIQKKMILHADGEYGGKRENLRFQCLPGVLKIRM